MEGSSERCFQNKHGRRTEPQLQDRVTGLVVVARDCHGRVMASFCQNIRTYYLPQTAEAMAILEGIHLVVNSGLLPVSLESNALSVVQVISKKEAPSSEVGVVVNDILRLLCQVDIVSVNFVPRLAISVAHGLARLALSHAGQLIWLEDCPLCVESLVLGISQILCTSLFF
ncbi:hypothetical protein Dsin_001061 [Dipteronia sinensis]|uniref:RNase H type-1 domain-containing protein n=1 Tax=Dipteronia sinensis TaxID=43782 RepID=A0AAE0EJY4_9ROSI|nr:hypothetical protein Dsin_001061 [Dipteronia sinensis]